MNGRLANICEIGNWRADFESGAADLLAAQSESRSAKAVGASGKD